MPAASRSKNDVVAFTVEPDSSGDPLAPPVWWATTKLITPGVAESALRQSPAIGANAFFVDGQGLTGDDVILVPVQ